MTYVTQWFRVGKENPNPTKPGLYEVRLCWPNSPVLKVYWDGAKWRRVGKFKPNESWGDVWRGLYTNPQITGAMMAYEKRDNSGAMFRNDKKEKDTHPDYKGTATIDGTEYWMDAWLKVSESGRKWMSFSFKAKEAKPAPKPAKKAPVQDDFDDVPF